MSAHGEHGTSFTRKVIETRITLMEGAFGAATPPMVLRSFGTSATVTRPGLPDKESASVTISGLSYETMARLTTLGFLPGEPYRNRIALLAGQEGAPLSSIFMGEIVRSWADFNTAPDPVLRIEALSGFFPSLIAEEPLSREGSVSLADLLGEIAARIGYSFENHGSTALLRNPVLNGSPLEKAMEAAAQVGETLLVEDDRMIVLPAGRARRGAPVALDARSGLVGYPTFTSEGVSFRCLFNPNLAHAGLVQLKSIVPRASGLWQITRLTHRLETSGPGSGAWFSEVEACYAPGEHHVETP
ncbi:hypothetical protein IHV25_07265 [Phaeovibrio sulfidiphilus]|uniref:Uncharacterized protein n=1 Tax=Phaeovibrio sulfidiphilus TaxID=1220600 RepID=A0A8J6YJE8_9PROT|nr:hypothetical protein [Phaeovibrio sulfidiphilus]MBE1237446.1 hypothetical protein [Phaeovibrio sulfidiphilus]